MAKTDSKSGALDVHEIEEKWKKYWEKEKIYKFDSSDKGVKGYTYSIDTPPPTVSGKMHIGHAFSYSQQDFIARYKRMSLVGKGQVFYPFGTDDNGLPTEKLIESLKGVKSKNLSRDDFIKLCLKTLKEVLPKFIQDWKDLAVSCDYNLYYSTIDDHARRISQRSFIELYKAGEIYRDAFPTIWDCVFQTPVAQAELEDKTIETLFSTLKFKVVGSKSNEDLLIATTRPELLAACGAVFVHPEDKRYKKFVGKSVKVPLFEHEVKVFADKSADIEKGTGVLMVCSYGDKYDVDAFKRLKLKSNIVINKDGSMNLKGYEGLKVKEAREKILQQLKERGFIVEQKKISHVVNVYEKSGNEIEFLPTEQWFIKILDKKKVLIENAKKIKWYPKSMFKRYENWVNGLEWDWSISRERHFGVPIPVWYCTKCYNVILPEEKELPVDPVTVKKKCPKCKTDEGVIPEEKVLDTWATSSLTPQISSSLVNGDKNGKSGKGDKVKIPFSLRPQAHDIIRTWAFYTIVKSYLHEKKIPWNDIIISGNVKLQGEKMSKSKGNVVDPQDVMERYGTDALRYWAASSKLGADLDYNDNDVLTGKKFVTKLINASRFVFLNLKDFNPQKKGIKLLETDKLFLAELNKLIKQSRDDFENYDYQKVKLAADMFFWQMFCDNYLEIVKKRIYSGSKEEKESASYALYHILLTLIKIFAPITPFVTEEVYQEYYKKNEKVKSIHLMKWPEEISLGKNKVKSPEVLKILLDLIARIRQAKSSEKRAMNAEIILTLEKKEKELLKDVLPDLQNVVNAKEIHEGKFNVRFV